jgi:hypothetical protein
MDIEAVKLANLANLTKQATLADREREMTMASHRVREIDDEIAAQNKSIGTDRTVLGRTVSRRRIKELEEERKGQQDIIQGYYKQLKAENELSKKADEEAKKAAANAPRNKSFWDVQKKSAEDALAAMDASAKGSEEWNKQMALLNEANDNLQTWSFGGNAKAAEKLADQAEKSAQERAELQRKLEDEVAQAKIDGMADGLAKTLAQNERNFQIEKRRIEEQYKELDQASRDFLIDEARTQTDTDNNKARKDAQNEALNGFRSFEQEYLRLYNEFQEKRRKAAEAGAGDTGLSLADTEFDESIKNLATKFAESNSQFQSWANGIKQLVDGALEDGGSSVIDAAINEISGLLNRAKTELRTMETGGINSAEAKKYGDALARVTELERELEKLHGNKTVKETNGDWKKLYSTLQKVEKEFGEIGDAVGGTAGEAIRLAGNIASATLSMIDGVRTVTSAAATSMQTLEKASVILAIVGAAIKIIQAVSSLFKDNEEQIRAATEATREYNAALKELNATRRLEKYDTVFGENSLGKFGEATKLTSEVLDELQEQINDLTFSPDKIVDGFNELGKSFSFEDLDRLADKLNGIEATFDGRSKWNKMWGSGDHKIKNYLFDINEFINADGSLKLEEIKAWYDAYQGGLDDAEKQALEDLIASGETYLQAMEAQTAYIEQLWGDVKSSITDAFADSYLEGEDFFEGLTDLAKDYAKELAKSMINKELSEKVFTSDLEDKLIGLLRSGDTVGANNLISEAIKSAGELAPYFESIMESVGLVAGVINDAANESRTSASQGFAQASQDSINLTNGILTNVESHTFQIDGNVLQIRDMMRTNQQIQQANTDAVLGHLAGIHTNTNRLEAVEGYLKNMNGSMENMADSMDKFNRG